MEHGGRGGGGRGWRGAAGSDAGRGGEQRRAVGRGGVGRGGAWFGVSISRPCRTPLPCAPSPPLPLHPLAIVLVRPTLPSRHCLLSSPLLPPPPFQPKPCPARTMLPRWYPATPSGPSYPVRIPIPRQYPTAPPVVPHCPASSVPCCPASSLPLPRRYSTPLPRQ